MNKALANLNRPKSFDDIAGQTHWIRAITKRIQEDRLPPVFIFAGPSGTGKTTTGLLVAKSLVCTKRQDYNPCNACAGCLSIEAGAGPNYIYLDGSGTDLANIVREDVKQMVSSVPVSGSKYRVCLIDEFQAFSSAAKSTLLTLFEDLSSKAVIICTTTDPDKIHEALRDRSYEVSFRPISEPDQVSSILSYRPDLISHKLGLEKLAKFSEGSQRKLWALIDKCEGDFTDETIYLVTGLGNPQERLELIDACFSKDFKTIHTLWSKWQLAGLNLELVSQQIVTDLCDLLVIFPERDHYIKAIKTLSGCLINKPEIFKQMLFTLCVK